jgi:hypothetical protein
MPDHDDASDYARLLAEAGCNHVHVYKGPCILPIHHDGPHQWRNPERTGPNAPPAEIGPPRAFVMGQRLADYQGGPGGVTGRCRACNAEVVLLSQESVRRVTTGGYAVLCAQCAVANFAPEGEL